MRLLIHPSALKSLISTRSFATAMSPSSVYTHPSMVHQPKISTTPTDMTQEDRGILDAAVRVDQAGEIAANYIYRGQMAVLGRHPTAGPIIQDMWDQEKKHLIVMDRLQAQHHVRPTALTGVAKLAGFGLGAVTALMGKEAAMACTEAVETIIGEHYDDQLKILETLSTSHPSIPLLKDVIREFRDEELQHLDTAVENFSQRAPMHALLSTIIGGGCKVAIELCQRI